MFFESKSMSRLAYRSVYGLLMAPFRLGGVRLHLHMFPEQWQGMHSFCHDTRTHCLARQPSCVLPITSTWKLGSFFGLLLSRRKRGEKGVVEKRQLGPEQRCCAKTERGEKGDEKVSGPEESAGLVAIPTLWCLWVLFSPPPLAWCNCMLSRHLTTSAVICAHPWVHLQHQPPQPPIAIMAADSKGEQETVAWERGKGSRKG